MYAYGYHAAISMRRKSVHRARRAFLLVLGLAIIGMIWSAELVARAGYGPAWLQFLFAASSPTGGLHVGLVAGHRGNDPGTVCDDGLTEVEVNTQIAELTAERLRSQGIRVDVLNEFDNRLLLYRADAFVSIHSDSCQSDFSGFKVAAPEGGSAASRRLADCLWDRYEAASGLPRHPSTITKDMTRYHAFRKLAPFTPAAIIELGFLGTDRSLLVEQPQRLADGVAAGILCFLVPETPQPDATTEEPQ
jgi:N-acetylmuramoyl-L-alanine amidase